MLSQLCCEKERPAVIHDGNSSTEPSISPGLHTLLVMQFLSAVCVVYALKMSLISSCARDQMVLS